MFLASVMHTLDLGEVAIREVKAKFMMRIYGMEI